MLRSFCDRCRAECLPQNSASRRFESLAVGQEGDPIGLEVLLLRNKSQQPDLHVCDECVSELLVGAIDAFPDAKVATEKQRWLLKLREYERTEEEFLKRKEANERKELEADAALRQAAEVKAIAERQGALDAEKIKVLQAQVDALRHAEEARQRQQQNAVRQAEEDMKYYPDYLERVEKREKRRAS